MDVTEYVSTFTMSKTKTTNPNATPVKNLRTVRFLDVKKKSLEGMQMVFCTFTPVTRGARVLSWMIFRIK